MIKVQLSLRRALRTLRVAESELPCYKFLRPASLLDLGWPCASPSLFYPFTVFANRFLVSSAR